MKRRSALTIGAILIALGAVGLIRASGAEWARMERLWPLLVMVGGTLAIREGLRQPRQESLWFGVTVLLCGGLFAYITLLGGGWRLLADWWPLVLGFAGLGWLAVWLTTRAQWSSAVLGALSILASVVLLLKNLGLLASSLISPFLSWWPWLLVLAGGALVAQGIISWRADANRD